MVQRATQLYLSHSVAGRISQLIGTPRRLQPHLPDMEDITTISIGKVSYAPHQIKEIAHQSRQ